MYSKSSVEKTKKKYPRGTKIKLISMMGEPQMKAGLCGTVMNVDDIGQIHVKWDSGSSLAINTDIDRFEIC